VKSDVKKYRETRIKRLKEILDMHLDGQKPSQIVSKICKKYEIKPAQAYKDIGDVKDDLKFFLNRNLENLVAEHAERYEFLYEKLMLIGNESLALDCLRQKEEILGISKNPVVININNEVTVNEEQKEIALSEDDENEFLRIVEKLINIDEEHLKRKIKAN